MFFAEILAWGFGRHCGQGCVYVCVCKMLARAVTLLSMLQWTNKSRLAPVLTVHMSILYMCVDE